MSLVDATLHYGNGDSEAVDTWQRLIPTEGQPGQAFHSSCLAALGLAKGAALTSDLMPSGSVIVLAVEQASFTSRQTNEKATMTIYKMLSCKAPSEASVSDEDVLEAIIGKTTTEVFKMRTDYKGTPYAQILGNKNTVLDHFKGKVTLGKSGKYEKAS